MVERAQKLETNPDNGNLLWVKWRWTEGRKNNVLVKEKCRSWDFIRKMWTQKEGTKSLESEDRANPIFWV